MIRSRAGFDSNFPPPGQVAFPPHGQTTLKEGLEEFQDREVARRYLEGLLRGFNGDTKGVGYAELKKALDDLS